MKNQNKYGWFENFFEVSRKFKNNGRSLLCAIIVNLVKIQNAASKVANDNDENEEFHK